MNQTSRGLIALLAAVLTGSAALAQQHAMSKGDATHPGTSQGMMAGMAKMNRDMASVPMTGDADRDFAAMMIPHHQGAIDMARVELQEGKDPAMRRLAKQVVEAQEKEIVIMKRWQNAHAAR